MSDKHPHICDRNCVYSDPDRLPEYLGREPPECIDATFCTFVYLDRIIGERCLREDGPKYPAKDDFMDPKKWEETFKRLEREEGA